MSLQLHGIANSKLKPVRKLKRSISSAVGGRYHGSNRRGNGHEKEDDDSGLSADSSTPGNSIKSSSPHSPVRSISPDRESGVSSCSTEGSSTSKENDGSLRINPRVKTVGVNYLVDSFVTSSGNCSTTVIDTASYEGINGTNVLPNSYNFVDLDEVQHSSEADAGFPVTASPVESGHEEISCQEGAGYICDTDHWSTLQEDYVRQVDAHFTSIDKGSGRGTKEEKDNKIHHQEELQQQDACQEKHRQEQDTNLLTSNKQESQKLSEVHQNRTQSRNQRSVRCGENQSQENKERQYTGTQNCESNHHQEPRNFHHQNQQGNKEEEQRKISTIQFRQEAFSQHKTSLASVKPYLEPHQNLTRDHPADCHDCITVEGSPAINQTSDNQNFNHDDSGDLICSNKTNLSQLLNIKCLIERPTVVATTNLDQSRLRKKILCRFTANRLNPISLKPRITQSLQTRVAAARFRTRASQVSVLLRTFKADLSQEAVPSVTKKKKERTPLFQSVPLCFPSKMTTTPLAKLRRRDWYSSCFCFVS